MRGAGVRRFCEDTSQWDTEQQRMTTPPPPPMEVLYQEPVGSESAMTPHSQPGTPVRLEGPAEGMPRRPPPTAREVRDIEMLTPTPGGRTVRCARAVRKVGHSPPPVGRFLGVGLPQGTIAIVYPCSINPPLLACMYPSPPLGDRGRSPSLHFLSVYFFLDSFRSIHPLIYQRGLGFRGYGYQGVTPARQFYCLHCIVLDIG